MTDWDSKHLPSAVEGGAGRVLHFFPRFFPYSWGGAENYIRGLIHWQQRHGAQASLLCGFPPEGSPPGAELVRFAQHSAFRYQHDGIEVLCVRPHEYDLYDYALFRKVKKLPATHVEDWKRIFRHFFERPITHVHVHSIERSFVYPHYLQALKEQNAGLRIHAHCHDPLPCVKGTLVTASGRSCGQAAGKLACFRCSTSWRDIPPHHGALYFLKAKHDQLEALLDVFRHLDRLCHTWVCYSAFMARNLLRNGVAEGKILLKKHGVDARFLVQEEQEKPAGVTHFAYLGRFVEAKGLAHLLEVWRQLPQAPDRKLFLIGSADQHSGKRIQDLLELVRRRADVVLLGRRSAEEIVPILRKIHCVIIPSQYQEMGPLVLNEALASRCAVIAADLGGLGEYAQDYASAAIHLFPHQDLSALRASIEHFVYRPPEARLRFMPADEHYRALLTDLARLGLGSSDEARPPPGAV